nr:t-complex protein 1 subunit delta [Quercus suber]
MKIKGGKWADSDSTIAELSKSQDSAVGGGTTTVVVIFDALLRQCLSLLSHGIHPTVISNSLHKVALKAIDVLIAMAVPIELFDHESLIKSASTSLNSKVVSQYSSLLTPLAINFVLSVVDSAKPNIIDLRDIKIVKKLGGTVDDTDTLRDLSVLPDETICAIFGFVFVTLFG